MQLKDKGEVVGADAAPTLYIERTDKTMKKEWIITMSGPDDIGVGIQRVTGTDEQIEEYIVQMVREEIEYADDSFYTATADVDDLDVEYWGISGYARFADHTVYYQAIPTERIESISL